VKSKRSTKRNARAKKTAPSRKALPKQQSASKHRHARKRPVAPRRSRAVRGAKRQKRPKTKSSPRLKGGDQPTDVMASGDRLNLKGLGVAEPGEISEAVVKAISRVSSLPPEQIANNMVINSGPPLLIEGVRLQRLSQLLWAIIRGQNPAGYISIAEIQGLTVANLIKLVIARCGS
jgi:hypothetical protein